MSVLEIAGLIGTGLGLGLSAILGLKLRGKAPVDPKKAGIGKR